VSTLHINADQAIDCANMRIGVSKMLTYAQTSQDKAFNRLTGSN